MQRDIPYEGALCYFVKSWIAYEIISQGERIYFGCCPTAEFHMTPDFRRLDMYDTLLPMMEFYIYALALFGDEGSARVYLREMMKTERAPQFNVCGIPRETMRVPGRKGKAVAVQCVKTGETWPSASEAARAIDCHISTMIKHLNGAPGYSEIKRKIYKRVGQ